MKLKDKNVIVTGAGRGFGKKIAFKYAKEGANIVVADLNLDSAKKMKEEIKRLGRNALGVKVDISNKEMVDNLIKTAINKLGNIDILVNNAGIGNYQPIQEITEAQWNRLIDVNLKGTYLCSKAIIDHMIKRESGKIINISSISGVTGRPVGVDYSASKTGIIGITRTLAVHVADKGINVNAIAPGPIITPLMKEYFSKKTVDKLLSTIPFKRQGKPEDIAETALFLASESAGWITGEVINVNGGAFIG